MTPYDAALRMALAAWLRDTTAPKTPEQAGIIRRRLLTTPHVPFTAEEVYCFTPMLESWATTLNPDLATVLRQVLGLEARPVVERARHGAYEAGRVRDDSR